MVDAKEAGEKQHVSRFEGEEHHGWAPDQDSGSSAAQEGKAKAFDAENAGTPGPGREVSQEEREGVPATDTSGATPLDVGDSESRRGEDIARTESEAGRQTVGTKGQSQRPHGTSTASDSTGINPQEPIDEESPELPMGDQGG